MVNLRVVRNQSVDWLCWNSKFYNVKVGGACSYHYALKVLLRKWFVACKCSWNSCWWKSTFPHLRVLEYKQGPLIQVSTSFCCIVWNYGMYWRSLKENWQWIQRRKQKYGKNGLTNYWTWKNQGNEFKKEIKKLAKLK